MAGDLPVPEGVTAAAIPEMCLHGCGGSMAPLPDCGWCGGSGRVPCDPPEGFPPGGTNACCCTCRVCRRSPRPSP